MRTQRSVRLIFVIWSFDEQQQRDGGVILFVSQFSISQYLNVSFHRVVVGAPLHPAREQVHPRFRYTLRFVCTIRTVRSFM